jgi:hypothetical protein
MTSGASTALIAASAAVFGGLVSAYATRSVERMRLEHALREKADERKLQAIMRFTKAAFAWFDWILLMAEQGLDEEVLREHNIRSRERQEAYRELQLIASADLFRWLASEYEPLEYEVRRTIGEAARWGRPLPAEAAELRRRYNRMLYKDLIERFRPEIAVLREPVPPRRRSRDGG